MIINQQEIEAAKQYLQNLYEAHHAEGILAIYIWGSVTRSDFDPKTSDIDVVCIVNDSFDKNNNEKYREELSEVASEREWGFQIIYLDELNGGPIRSRLAQAMSPQSVLPSFSSWVFVCGKDYSRNDFSVKDASIPERMQLNINEIRKRLSNISTDSDYKKVRDRKGVVKACLQLIYNRQTQRHPYFDLDYNVLPEKADEIERPILTDLLKIKNEGLYDELSYEQFIAPITQFADKVEKELG